MKKLKLSIEDVENIREEAVEEYKDRQWKDFKFGLLIVFGLALYIYLYEKVDVFGIIAIFVVTFLVFFLVAFIWGRFKR